MYLYMYIYIYIYNVSYLSVHPFEAHVSLMVLPLRCKGYNDSSNMQLNFYSRYTNIYSEIPCSITMNYSSFIEQNCARFKTCIKYNCIVVSRF